jgi:hypothetical protein
MWMISIEAADFVQSVQNGFFLRIDVFRTHGQIP